MCGLAGVIPARKRRSRKEMKEISAMFTRLLVLSEHRGPYATGVASVQADGSIEVVKRPVRARSFVRLSAYQEWLEKVSPRTTCLMGHTRWPTRGSILNPANNHPLVTEGPGVIVAVTHNGSLSDPDRHFRRLRLPRRAEVDSELLLRIAERHTDLTGLDLDGFLEDIATLGGLMSAAIVTGSRPDEIVLLKGNRPLEVRYHPVLRTMAYASEPGILDAALAPGGWREISLGESEGLMVHAGRELQIERFDFRFDDRHWDQAGWWQPAV